MLNISVVGLLDDALGWITTVINSIEDWCDAEGGCFQSLNSRFVNI